MATSRLYSHATNDKEKQAKLYAILSKEIGFIKMKLLDSKTGEMAVQFNGDGAGLMYVLKSAGTLVEHHKFPVTGRDYTSGDVMDERYFINFNRSNYDKILSKLISHLEQTKYFKKISEDSDVTMTLPC